MIAADIRGFSAQLARDAAQAIDALLSPFYDLVAEEVERVEDVLVSVAPALLDEDQLIDAGVGELPNVPASICRRADAARIRVARGLGGGKARLYPSVIPS